ncbi:DUF4365 domain-containing protein [Streptomyces sp. NPDC102395]|uniref:DUF4365 domain-containing protein n=1 Tax=Streptomyces sp. NPDC102395 TaxID=3366168 RepID=UPI0037F38547
MAKVLATKKTERAGVNAFKSTMEAAGHIVQEIDGGNDCGEDCDLSFTELGRRTGDLAAVQIKSGVKYRRAVGYAIPCRDHIEDWTKSKIPVIGVVYDPEMRACYWVNLTEYLRREHGKGKKPKSVPVDEEAILEGDGVGDMTAAVRQYISDTAGENGAPYRGMRGAIKKAIDERKHRREEHFVSAPIGGHPIPPFEAEADFLERHPNFIPRLLAVLAYSIMITVTWPCFRASMRLPVSPLLSGEEADNAAHRKVRARVKHVIGRMKNYKILRDCRQHSDGLHRAVQAVARMHNLALAS